MRIALASMMRYAKLKNGLGKSLVDKSHGKPSAETGLHLLLAELPDTGSVLHTHSVWNTLLSDRFGEVGFTLEKFEMLKGLEGLTTHATEARIPVLVNDQDLPRLSAKARPHLGKAPHGLLIAGHGLYAWGRDLDTAMRHLEILEFLLEQRWRQLLLQALTAAAPAPTWNP